MYQKFTTKKTNVYIDLFIQKANEKFIYWSYYYINYNDALCNHFAIMH